MCTGHISYAVGVSSAKMDNTFLLLHKWGTISKERNPITAPTFAIKLDSLKKTKKKKLTTASSRFKIMMKSCSPTHSEQGDEPVHTG